mmetsp:Transcript_5034/g.9496  ORF Transcript_5034/g.9496 Transcript_5034/m.9496 type:complete len:223 (+) Transcript_5034:70-738(+)
MAAPMIEEEKKGPLGKCEYVICLCEAHRLAHCHQCFFDFRDMNDQARDEAADEELLLCRAPSCMNQGSKKCSGCGNVRYCGKECQTAHWKKHKKVCKKKDSKVADNTKGDKRQLNQMRVNLACYHLEDEFVNAFDVNTRLVSPTRNDVYPDLYAKVISLNAGRGPYVSPEAKYDPKKFPGYEVEDMCTYTLQYKDGKVARVNCVDVHSDFQIVVKKSPDDDA